MNKYSWAYYTSRYCFGDAAAGTGGGTPSTPAPAPAPSSTPAAPAITPSSAPSSSPSGEGAGAPGSDSASDPLAGFDDNFDSDMDSIEISDAPPTDGGAAEPPAPQPAPAPAPAAPAPAATPPTQVPAPPAAPAPDGTSPAPPGDPLTTTVEGLKANSVALADWAGQNLFKLSDEESAALATNAEEMIPKLMGRTFAQANVAAANMIRTLVPELVQRMVADIQTKTARSSETLNQFYSTNADLKQKEHGDAVRNWARTFRQANPKATKEQAFDFVARAVRIQFGLPLPGAHVPAAPAAQPFAPARPGGRPPTSPEPHDPYAGLGMDLDEG